MTFTNASGRTGLCSGTLMNDARNSGTPYFLSANHCISTQASASSLQTRWFFRSASCNASPRVHGDMQRLTGGARLLYATARTDTAFMVLNDAPPAGVRYAGSYFGNADPINAKVLGVHHPRGDLQKYSEGGVQGYAVCAPGDARQCAASQVPAEFLHVRWSRGTTEGGSSGSGLFGTIGSTRYVIGQLLGGGASCENPEGADLYGRFNLAYHDGIRRWLNP